jgi:hypothetical protein
MKYIIDIPDEMYEQIKDGYVPLGISKYLKNGTPYKDRPHGEWVAKPKRIQVDETDEERIFETRQEWFCSSCGKRFGLKKPEDAFCKYCGSDNKEK